MKAWSATGACHAAAGVGSILGVMPRLAATLEARSGSPGRASAIPASQAPDRPKVETGADVRHAEALGYLESALRFHAAMFSSVSK